MSSIPRLLPKRQGEKMAEHWRLRGACRITEGAEEGGAVQQATCLSGPGIGNHFICITQFSVPYQWPDSPTELVLYSRYTNLSIQSKHPYQHTALHHNEVWIVLVSCCVPTVVLFPSQEVRRLRPSAERKMASKIILLAVQRRELLIIRKKKKWMKKLLEMQAKWFLFSPPPPKNQIFCFPRYSIYVFRLHGGVRANTQMQSQ